MKSPHESTAKLTLTIECQTLASAQDIAMHLTEYMRRVFLSGGKPDTDFLLRMHKSALSSAAEVKGVAIK